MEDEREATHAAAAAAGSGEFRGLTRANGRRGPHKVQGAKGGTALVLVLPGEGGGLASIWRPVDCGGRRGQEQQGQTIHSAFKPPPAGFRPACLAEGADGKDGAGQRDCRRCVGVGFSCEYVGSAIPDT